MPDPIIELLKDIRRARGRIRADLSRLPVSAPMLALLDEVETILERTETDLGNLNDVIRATMTMGVRSPGEIIGEVPSGPIAWLRPWGRKGAPGP